MAGQIAGRRFAHLADPQGVDEAGQGGVPGVIDGGQHVFAGLLTHPFQLDQRFQVQPVEIRRVPHQLGFHQLLEQLVANALDIHRQPGGEVLEPFLALGLAAEHPT